MEAAALYNLTTHSFRRSSATYLREYTYDIRTLQEHLSHRTFQLRWSLTRFVWDGRLNAISNLEEDAIMATEFDKGDEHGHIPRDTSRLVQSSL